MKKVLLASLASLMMICALSGCTRKDESDKIIQGSIIATQIEEKNRSKFMETPGVSIYEEKIESKLSSSFNELLLNLNSEKIDSFLVTKSTADALASQSEDYITLDTGIKQTAHMATRISDKDLASRLDKAITELKEEGKIDNLKEKYVDGKDVTNAAQEITGEGETFTVGVTGDFMPLDFISADGVPAGFNVAIMQEIAKKMGCNFKFIQIESNARLTALESRKIDIIFYNRFGNFEGSKIVSDLVNVSVPYFEDEATIVALKKNSDKVKKVFDEIYESMN